MTTLIETDVVVYSPVGFEYRLNIFRFGEVRQPDVGKGLVLKREYFHPYWKTLASFF